MYVYVIAHRASGPSKIGKSAWPSLRLVDLQCGSPFPLKLWATQELGFLAARVEEVCHAMLRARGLHSHGEWFRISVSRAEAAVSQVAAAAIREVADREKLRLVPRESDIFTASPQERAEWIAARDRLRAGLLAVCKRKAG